MADNKGQAETDSSASMESEPAGTVNGDTAGQPAEAAAITEAATKDGGDKQSGENTSPVSTPAAADGGGGESNDSSGGGGEEGGGEGGEVSTSPDGNGNRNESVEAAEISGASGGSEASTSAPAPASASAPAPAAAAGSSPAPPAEPSPAAPPPPAAPINLLDTCAVCKQSLQNRDCEPKLLPCLHSFCLKCIPQPERQISVGVPGPHGQDTHIGECQKDREPAGSPSFHHHAALQLRYRNAAVNQQLVWVSLERVAPDNFSSLVILTGFGHCKALSMSAPPPPC